MYLQLSDIVRDIRRLKSKKSTVIEIISPYIYKVNRFSNQTYDFHFLSGIISLVHKAANKTHIENYRPIVVLNQLAKIF